MTTADPTFTVIEAHRHVVLDDAGEGPFEREKADLLVGYIDDLLERHGNRARASAYHGELMDRRATSAEELKRRR
jgi:hypothetical protein